MVMTKYIHRVCNNICEITIVKRSPGLELTERFAINFSHNFTVTSFRPTSRDTVC